MAIELRQSLKLAQQLVITPQLQQAIKLLQLSRLELADVIQTELMENPVLEEGPQAEEEEVPAEMAKEIESEEPADKSHEAEQEVGNKDGELKEPKEFDWENYAETYNNAPGEGRALKSLDELPNYENMTTKPTTLQGHLEWQLQMTLMSDWEKEIGLELIACIDENGYLSVSLEEFCEKYGYSLEQAGEALSNIQEFDPPGVGARDLKECLLLQTKLFQAERPLLEAIISEHLPLLEKRDYPTLSRRLKVPLQKIITAAKIIANLEPKPGRPYDKADTQYVTPDVYVYKAASDYNIVLNDEGLPQLRVSAFYRNMISKNGNGAGNNTQAAKNYVQEKLKSALWLIKSIHQRQRTLYKVSKCIVKFQRDFFDKGVHYLKPMILKDVAEEIGMHESTVSRATSNKYMHTSQGLFELKYFFNSAVNTTSGTADVASEAVKEKIRNIIAAENAKEPLSDKVIVDMLKQSNIEVARRTVAKYREMLGILPSSKRRQLY